MAIAENVTTEAELELESTEEEDREERLLEEKEVGLLEEGDPGLLEEGESLENVARTVPEGLVARLRLIVCTVVTSMMFVFLSGLMAKGAAESSGLGSTEMTVMSAMATFWGGLTKS